MVVKAVLLLLAVLLCGTVSCIQDMSDPVTISMAELDEEARRVQHHFLRGEEIEGGKEHQYEGHHYDEVSGSVHYQKGSFTLHPRAIVLDGKAHIKSIRCTKKGHIKIVSSSKKFADKVKDGSLLFFGAGHKSGCHKLHSNGHKGVNFFLVTDLLSSKEVNNSVYVLKAVVEAEDPKLLIRDATFLIHRGPASETPKYFEEDEAEELEVEGEALTARQLIKRSLPTEVHTKLKDLADDATTRLVLNTYHKRGFRSWWNKLKEKVTSVGSDVKTILTQAFTEGRDAVQRLKDSASQKAREAWDFLKTEVTNYVNKEVKLEMAGSALWSHVGSAEHAPFKFSSKFELTPTATLGWKITEWVLQEFHVSIAALPTAELGVSFVVSAKKTLADFKIIPPTSLGVPLIIPLGPLAGIAITLKADYELDFEAVAEFKLAGTLFTATAEGKLGYSAKWLKPENPTSTASRWTLAPVTGFKWGFKGPSVDKFEASLTATLTPKIHIGVGVNLAYLLSITGGPVLGLPIIVALEHKDDCPVALSWDVRFSLSVSVGISAIGYNLLTAETKALSWSIKAGVSKLLENPETKEKEYFCLIKKAAKGKKF